LNDVLGSLELDLGFETNAISQDEVVVSLMEDELFQGSDAIFRAHDVRAVHDKAGVSRTRHRVWPYPNTFSPLQSSDR